MDILKQAHEKFGLFNQIPIGVCVLRSDYVVLFWNACLEEWSKIPKNVILGTVIAQHFAHFNQSLYRNRLEQIFQGGPPTIFSSQLHPHIIPSPLSRGRKRIQHTTVTSVPAIEENGFYAMLSVQDVTDLTLRLQDYRHLRDQAMAEAELSQHAKEVAETANRIKDEFLAIVSHELRSPLNPILGWAKLLKAQTLNEVRRVQALDAIVRNAELQAQLIDDLLDVSRILRGKLALNFEIVDLAVPIQAALETVHLAAEAKSIQIHLDLNPNVNRIRGDAARLQQVVWNLLSNAIKFTPRGGQVKVNLEQVVTMDFVPEVTDKANSPSVSIPSSVAQITVSDTGKGIPLDFLPYVFEAFRQEDSSTTRTSGGLGLGLAIVRQLVELHGGTIQAESLGEGRGATFQLKLPVLQEDKQASIEATKSPSVLAAPLYLDAAHILVVDDDVDTREFLAFLLEQHGAQVTATASAKEALAAISQAQPDLVLSDLGMPDCDGYAFIRQLRSLPAQEGGEIPAIALTAYAAEATRQQVIAAGFQRYVTKPADPIKLLTAIAKLLTNLQF
ncbi:MAG: response regulator [Chroococcidiopsidaceae cyanobacterium CP_BM_RX_35]|nr:response regulator [Chroococcidiopsidaceae cyanobacterium CP_BM_RX_35]